MLVRDSFFSDLGEVSGNAENISLAEFVHSEGQTLLERVLPFSFHYRKSIETGKAHYSRQVMGAVKNRTQVKDHRTGDIREMIMLGSNNYLGLTTHPKVQEAVLQAVEQYGVGMGGPPLLNGMSSLHRQLEEGLARLKGGNEYDAMLFGSGYQANLGWIKGLMRNQDVLIYDELSHASLFDGIALMGSHVHAIRFRHNDVDHLQRLLERFSKRAEGQIFVAIEGVYSMDGDLAPVPEVNHLCKEYGAILVIDDAHGTGVLGQDGAGTAEHFGLQGQVDISMGTFSKSFGVTGGFVVAKRPIIDYLRFFARSYMFSAHLPPSTAAAVIAGLNVIRDEPHWIQQLHQNASYVSIGLRSLGYQVKQEAAVIPIFIPPQNDIREINRWIHENGVFLNSVEYPAVPLNAQRLRVSVMATHSKDDLDQALGVFTRLKQEFML